MSPHQNPQQLPTVERLLHQGLTATCSSPGAEVDQRSCSRRGTRRLLPPQDLKSGTSDRSHGHCGPSDGVILPSTQALCTFYSESDRPGNPVDAHAVTHEPLPRAAARVGPAGRFRTAHTGQLNR